MNRVLRDGIFYVNFLAEDDGTIGIVFRFQDINNYYMLEITGSNKKSARVRKVQDSRYSVLF